MLENSKVRGEPNSITVVELIFKGSGSIVRDICIVISTLSKDCEGFNFNLHGSLSRSKHYFCLIWLQCPKICFTVMELFVGMRT